MKLVNRIIQVLSLAITIATCLLPAAVYAQNTVAPTSTLIHDIQEAAQFSSQDGKKVSDVPGVVTAVRTKGNSKGFFMQDSDPDNDETTSEGIFVFTRDEPDVEVGDAVLVSGVVKEFTPSGNSSNLSLTQINASGSSAEITIQSRNNPLPDPIIIGRGGRIPPKSIIDDDSLTDFEPNNDAIDFYETLEGMRVQVNDAVVVGSTEGKEIIVLADKGANTRTRSIQGGVVIEPGDFNPERVFIGNDIVSNQPEVNVGNTFTTPIVGVLDYSSGNFKLLNTEPLPRLIVGRATPETTSLASATDQLAIATFNVENLDPGDGNRFDKIGDIIAKNLKSPDIVTVIEVQDNNGSTNDSVVDAERTYNQLIKAIEDANGSTYEFRDIAPIDDQDGGQEGGNIRVGFLFRPDRVSLVNRPQGNSTTATEVINSANGPDLSLNPGRIDPNNSAFNDSRKPLVAEFLFNGQKVFVIANHFNSKREDDSLFGRIQPPVLKTESKRIEQAKVVNQFVNQLLNADPDANVIVLGDLNDFEFSNPLKTLKGNVLEDLVERVPLQERYTFNFGGNSQVLDHILVSKHLVNSADPEIDIVHLNAGFANKVSDHDPVVARLKIVPGTVAVTNPSPRAKPVALLAATTTTLFPGEIGKSLIKKLADEFSPTDLLNYNRARDLLYANIDSKNNVLTCIYTGFQIRLDPKDDPTSDAEDKGINAEHVWPQSRGAESVKSDLHNIYPSRIDVNSMRGNKPFADLLDSLVSKWFREDEERTTIPPTRTINEYSELTSSEFEPREDAKGNVARAVFYFRTIYSDKAEPGFFERQKAQLCQWHKDDPADAAEIARSRAIASLAQGNENPFILDPTLAERTYCN